MSSLHQPPTLRRPDVEIRVSARRKKTAGAHWEGDRIVVVVPSHLRGVERETMVDHLAGRLARRRPLLHTADAYLASRAAWLGDHHLDGVHASSIRWSSTQLKRWGSCTTATREIRISERLRVAPTWVLDAVIVHELAHLIEPSHNARFRALEDRYPKKSEADAFLAGYSLGLHMTPDKPEIDRESTKGHPSEPDGGV